KNCAKGQLHAIGTPGGADDGGIGADGHFGIASRLAIDQIEGPDAEPMPPALPGALKSDAIDIAARAPAWKQAGAKGFSLVGDLDHTRSIDALEINIRALAVARAGEGQPFAAGIEHDIGVMAFLSGSVLLEGEIRPRFAGTIDGRAKLAVDVDDGKNRRVWQLRVGAAVLRSWIGRLGRSLLGGG